MGKRGPKSEPTTLKLLKGTFRKDRVPNGGNEPTPEVVTAVPPPPANLGDWGKYKWAETANVLVPLRLLTVADMDALWAYCAAWDELVYCDWVLQTMGHYAVNDKGRVQQHPAVNRRFRVLDIIRRYQMAFGMTPADRTGVSPAKEPTGVRSRVREQQAS